MVFISYIFLFSILFIVPANFYCYSQDTIESKFNEPKIALKKNLIGEIIIEGNQKTNKKIILRELKFSEGEAIDSISLAEAICESKKNLLKLPLFNFVTIEPISSDSDFIKIRIIVEERWFIWPQFSIINNDRNFNTWLKNKDFGQLDYRIAVKQYNVLGLNHILSIGLSYGYTREFSLSYQNIFLDKDQKHFLGVNAKFFGQQSAFYITHNNKQESFSNSNVDVLEGKNLAIDYNFRPQYNSRNVLIISYNQVLISDSMAKANPSFLGNSKTISNFFELRYHYICDKRDSRSYPLNGYFFDIGLTKTGLGFIHDNNVDLFSTVLTIKEFYQISNRFYGAHSISIKKSLENDQPYYYKQGLGFRDFLRGYEYYVIDCEDYYLLKNTVIFELLHPTISNLNFIPVKKFKKIHYAVYLKAFFDIGYANEKNNEILIQNNLSNQLLYSGGLGIDFSTYYDKVISFDYSINSLGEPGLFIHFKAPI